MPYEITAARKRPQGFGELAGQDFVSATLEASLASGRIAHAYLFSGPRGCGKTSTARILAKALNCEKGPTATPCGECAACKAITAGSSLDVIEIDGASNTSVDNVRQIKDEVLFPPNGGRYKVYIIDEVHMLSMSAFNALLKTIEEPPPYVVFIFATTELHKVPATIKSRCQQFAFRLVPIPTIKALLAKAAKELGVEAEDDALLWIAKESGGSPRDAYTLFDQVVAFSEGRITSAKIRDKLGLVGLDAMNGLFESLVCRQPGAEDQALEGSVSAQAGLEALDGLLERGVSPEQLVIDAIEYCRSLLLLKNGIARESLLGAAPDAYSVKVIGALNSEQIERALSELLELHRNIRFSADPRFELELACARLARLPDYVSVSKLASTVAALRRRIAGASPEASGNGGHPGSGVADSRSFPSFQAPASSSPARGSPLPPQPSRGAETGAAAIEKKKPELPTSLKSAFSSLAATVKLGAAGDDEEEGDGSADSKESHPQSLKRKPEAAKAPSAKEGASASPQPQASAVSAPAATIAASSASPADAAPEPSPADPSPASPAPSSPRTSSAFVVQPPPPREDDFDGDDEGGEDGADGGEDDIWSPSPEPLPSPGPTGGRGDALGPSVSGAPAIQAVDPGEAEKLKAAVLESMGRSSPLLSTGLAASLPWILEENRLVIPFRSGMEESVVKSEISTVALAVAKAAGRAIKVDLRVNQPSRQGGASGAAAGEEDENDAAAIVARVFRGQRIQPRTKPQARSGAGGNDGF